MRLLLLQVILYGLANSQNLKSAVKYPVQTSCMEKDLPGDIKSVTCYGSLPESGSLSSQVAELNINKATINALQSSTIKNLRLPQSITTLRITGCGINRIDENVFESLPNLRFIDLSNNNLVQIPSALFRYTPKAEEIILHSNKLPTLPGDCFSKTVKLVSLNLNDNLLTGPPTNLPKPLTRLYLQNNKISRVPLMDLPNLNDLNLCGNGITFFPQEVVGYPKLESLCVGSVELEPASNGFQKLKDSLKKLTIDGSRTQSAILNTDVVRSISSCQQLEVLHIKSYRLQSINFVSSFNNLQQLKLQTVEVDHSNMPKPSLFRNCPKMQTLDLTESPQLAKTILYNEETQKSLQELKHLVVRNCGLTSLNWFPMPTRETSKTALPFPQLNTIDVSRNRLNCSDERTYQTLCYFNSMTSNFTRSTKSGTKGSTEPRIVNKPDSDISFPNQMTVENTDQTVCFSSRTNDSVSVMAMDFSNCNQTFPTSTVRPIAPRSNDTLPTPEEQGGLSNTDIWYIVLGVLLFILLILAIVLIVICCIKKRRRGAQPIPSSARLEDGKGQPQSFQKLKEASSEDKLLSPKK